jgi:hypothetical protein
MTLEIDRNGNVSAAAREKPPAAQGLRAARWWFPLAAGQVFALGWVDDFC